MKHQFSAAVKGRKAFGCEFPGLSQQCTRCNVVRAKTHGVWHYHNRVEGLGTGLEDKCGLWPCVPHGDHYTGEAMAGLQSVFRARLVDDTGAGTLTDGGVLWEVVTRDDERIGDCTVREAAELLATTLNLAVTAWVAANPGDRTTG